MSALVDSILSSCPSAILTEPQLNAISGALCSESIVLSPDHALFKSLENTLVSPTFATVSTQFLRACLDLSATSVHRPIILSLLESHYAVIDRVSSSFHSQDIAADGSSSTLRNSEGFLFLSYLTLLLLAVSSDDMKCVDLFEFIGGDVSEMISVVIKAYAIVCSPSSGMMIVQRAEFQCYLVYHLARLLRELTYWTSYEILHERFGIGSNQKKAQSGRTASLPMSKLSGPFRHYIGTIISQTVSEHFFTYVAQYFSTLSLLQGRGGVTEVRQMIREHFLLLDGLLTLTDQCTHILRRDVANSKFVQCVCAPVMVLLAQPGEPCWTDRICLLTVICNVTSTLAFRCGEHQRSWAVEKQRVSLIIKNVADELCCLPGEADRRLCVELVAQLTRFVVNTHSSAAGPLLLQVWRAFLTDEEKKIMAHSLSNPMHCRRSLDVFSPTYDVLRPLFIVDSTAAVAGKRSRRLLEEAVPTNDHRRARSQSRGRGGSRRLQGRGGGWGNQRWRSASRGRGGRSRSRGRRQRRSRRERVQERFKLLKACTSSNVAATADEANIYELSEALHVDSSSSDDESVDDASGDSSPLHVQAPVDLTPWRRCAIPPKSIPTRYVCSLSYALIKSSPVVSSTGYVFDEDVILDFLKHYNFCPISGEPLSSDELVVDTALKEELNRIRSNFVHA